MTTAEENFKLCTNCDKQIPSNKWILHENFCVQHVKKCDICGEIINREEEEDHIQDVHSKRKCDICEDEFQGLEYYNHKQTCLKKDICKFCKKEFPPKVIQNHINNCDLNLYNCNYCFSDYPLKDKHDHEYFCGSKTEKCSRCNKFVKLREMNMHISLDCHPEEVTLNQQIDLNSIQVKQNRKASGKNPVGVIASLNQMGILHRNDSISKIKKDDGKNSIIDTQNKNSKDNNTPTQNDNHHSKLNNINSNQKINKTNKKIENINEHINITKHRNLKNDSKHINEGKIEKNDITKNNFDNFDIHNNLQKNIISSSAKEKLGELKNSNLLANNDKKSTFINNQENHKKFKEIEKELASLNRLGKNYENINLQIDKINNINNKINLNKGNNANLNHQSQNKIQGNVINQEKKEQNLSNKTLSNNIINKHKNQDNNLEINYGVFQDKKFNKDIESPKFNVFYEKHESPYNSQLNDEDFIQVNKNAKDKFMINHKYENINNHPTRNHNNTNREGNKEINNLINNLNKNNPTEKDSKKKKTEDIKNNKGPLIKPGSANEYKENKIIPKEKSVQINKNNNFITNNDKINSVKPNQNDKIIKEIPYIKHHNINSNKTDQIIKGNLNNNKLSNNKCEKKEALLDERKNTPIKSIYEINNIFKSDASKINSKNDLISLENYINEKGFNHNKINKKEEKINNIDNSKKPAYITDRTKEPKEKIVNKTNLYNNNIMKNGNIKATKKTQNINAKNFNFEDYQDDYLIEEELDMQEHSNKKFHKEKDNNELEDEILNRVILDSLKHR